MPLWSCAEDNKIWLARLTVHWEDERNIEKQPPNYINWYFVIYADLNFKRLLFFT